MLSTVIMPYANYDDVQSLCAVYNNCLKQDADMNLLEFIGEKLLMTGFDPEEKEELPNPHSKQNPVNENAIVQIQSGVLFQVAKEEINLSRTEIVRKNIPTKNTVFFTQEFNPGIFHPPAILAS